ncbi:hypothetical protein FA95DRAFT_1373619 [Auriscalpium vulgare]|uniref:Uncharacterized protein n=1 Tax=Auriscalpium vulgare TaxID=40419 RepID=A0ACB8R1V7_9AGAM|nr:hypothetical protein FA95DRAFT_1373619 [Auriscalpium vulgare]
MRFSQTGEVAVVPRRLEARRGGGKRRRWAKGTGVSRDQRTIRLEFHSITHTEIHSYLCQETTPTPHFPSHLANAGPSASLHPLHLQRRYSTSLPLRLAHTCSPSRPRIPSPSSTFHLHCQSSPASSQLAQDVGLGLEARVLGGKNGRGDHRLGWQATKVGVLGVARGLEGD